MSEKETCGVCQMTEDDDGGGEKWLECSLCKQWYHAICAKVASENMPSETDQWLCTSCDTQDDSNENAINTGGAANSNLMRLFNTGSITGGVTSAARSSINRGTVSNAVNENSASHAVNENDKHGTNETVNAEDTRVQIKLMADLIKEKEKLAEMKQQQLEKMEEICKMKQQQLEMMTAFSEKSQIQNTTNWSANTNQIEGECSTNVNSMRQHQPNLCENVTLRKHQQKNINVREAAGDNGGRVNSAVRYGNARSDTEATRTCNDNTHDANTNATGIRGQGHRMQNVDKRDDLPYLMKRQMQLMSQQYLADLPEFDGEAEMWPIFYHQYLTTTEQGGFDDAFNMIRLRKCLRGEAREAVKGLLAMPNCLSAVMTVLEKRFGTNEVIVKRKLKKLANLVPPNENKPQTMRQFYEFLLGLNATLKSAEADDYLQSPQMIDAVIDKLPPHMRRKWMRYVSNFNNRPTLEDFLEWFVPYYDCAIDDDKDTRKAEQPTKRTNIHVNVNADSTLSHGTASGEGMQCRFCRKAKHSIVQCHSFQKTSLKNRWLFVRRRILCFICLHEKHRREDCNQKNICGVGGCKEFHHKLLHSTRPSRPTEAVLSTLMSPSDVSTTHYRSLPVTLHNPVNNKSVVTWAFLDEGSSPTMISNDIADELGLKGEVDELCTAWTDDSVRKDVHSRRVKLNISGVGLTRKFTLNNVRTVSQLKLPLPTTTHQLKSSYVHLKDVVIPDVPIARPTILIGLEHAKMGLMYETREGKWNEPVASRTRLGWVIHGKEVGGNKVDYVCHVCDCKKPEELSELMRSFYSTESLGVSFRTEVETQENVRARKILEETTKYADEQYETGLLWKSDGVRLPESKQMAIKRLSCFEQRLKRDEQLMSAVKIKMNEHIAKGYLLQLGSVDTCNIKFRHWYLPMFAVQNPNKPGKPRLVFDAAAKSHGVSLNSMLLKGPEMQVTLIGIMMRFRQRKIAVSADIAEMFHRIKITEDDQSCQLILWRDCDETKSMDVYKMTRMTFGATCSPCSANYVKNQNARRYANKYPRAVEAIIYNHYVDDLLECFDDESQAMTVAQQIQMIHATGGFHIRNWVSNSKKLEREMNSNDETRIDVNMDVSDESATEKILGMYWTTQNDSFVFKVNLSNVNIEVANKQRLPTKREMLRIIMSQYDPLGILAPVIVHAKIAMQSVWKHGGEWDDEIPLYLDQKWHDWLDALQQVSQLQLPRCYFRESEHDRKNMVLHLFADASEEAFAAVAYVQVKGVHETYVSFIAAKSRVAPQKSLTIPRLELQAAVLATRLKKTILEELPTQFGDVVFWTDSQTVVGWIRSTTRKYSAFVSHRVSEILDSSVIDQWRWLPTELNVADEATRSVEIPRVTERWLYGPEFLRDDEAHWPVERKRIATTHEEAKLVSTHHDTPAKVHLISIDRFSKYERLLRCAGYILRFKRRLMLIRNKSRPRVKAKSCAPIEEVPPLAADELNCAELLLFKIVQGDHYETEIRALSGAGQQVSRKSNLYNLCPVLDENGILRMASRIEVAPPIVDANLKQPTILHREHPITALLIDSVHRKFQHVNKEYVVNHIRQHLWIPKIRAQVNKVISRCQFCKSRLAKPVIPRMAPLPQSRLCPFQPPFSHTGIDFFGPMEVTIGRRHEKRWGVLFVCLTMRAIHLELAASLDTSAAIMCVRNFINRRGPPIEMISDNGTNLRASEKELKKAVEEIDFKRLQSELAHPLPYEIRTTWKFIPPSAPHFGGSWERMIRTVKQSLYIILKCKYPKEDTLRSALIEIENLVNSRPLYYSPNDVDNTEAITPNHLLRGSGRQVVPLLGDFNCRKQWRVSQSLADEFWKRWLYEYLPTISTRTKWQADTESIQMGQLVLIVDNTLQRGEWRKGIITKIFPSSDGRIRTVEVKTPNGFYLRPVAKLAIVNPGNAV